MDSFEVKDLEENGVEDLLVWWSEAMASDNYVYPESYNLFSTSGRPLAGQGIEATTLGTTRGRIPVQFKDYDTGYEALLEIGDTIEYKGQGRFSHNGS